MASIKLINNLGVSEYPDDLKNMSYDDAVFKMDLLEMKSAHDDFEAERPTDNTLIRTYPDGSWERYEVEE